MAWTTLAFLVLAGAPADTVQRASAFPARLESYLTEDIGLSADQRRQLLAGNAVTKLLEVDHSSEIRVFGAIWIAAPIRRYVELLNDIERFERGRGFRITTPISAPPRLEDFAEFALPAADVEELRGCRVGDCGVKLGAEALLRLRTEVQWQDANAYVQANALIRQLALDYVNQYLSHGNEGLAVYCDHARPISVAREFKDMIDKMPELRTQLPDMREYLLGYPRVTLPGSASFLYWQITEFGLKPTIRISHVTVREGADETVVASKMLYASHYFWTALELRRLVSDPARGPGFWFVVVNTSRSDGLTGFTGLFVRPRVRSGVRSGALAALQRTRDRLQQPLLTSSGR
jgi:hypothetical protein